MKKRVLLILFSLLIGCSLLIVSFAHSGRTDAKGGHYNRSTGEYHYHHGYSAHSHYDIDGDGYEDCPFDFKDNTTRSEKSTTKSEVSTTKSEVSTTKSEVSTTKSEVSTTNKKSSSWLLMIIEVLSLYFGGKFIFRLFFPKNNKKQ